jgi:hypothetical protein
VEECNRVATCRGSFDFKIIFTPKASWLKIGAFFEAKQNCGAGKSQHVNFLKIDVFNFFIWKIDFLITHPKLSRNKICIGNAAVIEYALTGT